MTMVLRPAAHLVLLIHATGRHAQIHSHIVIVSSVLFAVRSLTRVIRLIIHVLTVGHPIVARHALFEVVLHVDIVFEHWRRVNIACADLGILPAHRTELADAILDSI